MAAENPRVLELRRRVQADPASIAFAELAEECRRSGDNDEAVGICRAGLAYHPDLLSARVTLGRALVELGRLDEAQTELLLVLKRAPDNLPANRAIAEMAQLRGQMPPKGESAPTAIEDLFDFDTLLEQLGVRTQPKPESVLRESDEPAMPVAMSPSELDTVELRDDDGDPFSALERQLRDTGGQRPYEAIDSPVGAERESDRQLIAELDDWLSAITTDRNHRPSA